jgi:hypothetical protein
VIEIEQIKLLRSLFHGRDDVFAIRWETGNKSGYMPSYQFDPYHYRIHKAKGGTLSNYSDKTYQPLTDEQIKRHLLGHHLIGIYPLLPNNSSNFIAADFDGDNWLEEAQKCIKACETSGLPVYLERSRSGNGGHVCLFFSEAYPAFKSRKVFLSLLQSTGIFSVFDKDSSFDRDLGYIRANGRQTFIEKPRDNFSRIIHDYADVKKGFILWRDQLQSRLV